MIEFNKPNNLNGAELKAELAAAGIELKANPFIDGEGKFYLDINSKDKSKAEVIVANHDGNMIPNEATIDEKLASVGLNLNDLKAALGLTKAEIAAIRG